MIRPVIKVVAAILCLTVVGVQPTMAGDEAAEKSLYDRLGGLPAISVVVNDFIDVIFVDEKINENPAVAESRDRVPSSYLKYHVTAMVCQVTGGPCQYHGRSMEASHGHLNITEAEWDRMVEIIKEVMAKHKVPEKEVEEVLSIIGTTKGDIVKSSDS